MNHYVIPVIADKHSLHDLGLLNPQTEFYRKGKNNEFYKYSPDLSPDQEELWELHQEIIDTSVKMAHGDPIILYDLGDMGHGMKYVDDVQSLYMADHIVAPYWTLIPWMKLPNLKRAYLLAGTSAHELGAGSLTVLVAQMLANEFRDKEIVPVYHGVTTIADGFDVDYSHHGPGQSARKWLEGNNARYYLRDLMWDDIINGRRPPRLVIRGDKHSIINEIVTIWANNSWYESRIILVPPLCKMGDYARKVTKSAPRIVYGGVIFEVIDGRVMEPVWITRSEDIRKRDELWKEKQSTKPKRNLKRYLEQMTS